MRENAFATQTLSCIWEKWEREAKGEGKGRNEEGLVRLGRNAASWTSLIVADWSIGRDNVDRFCAELCRSLNLAVLCVGYY